MTDARCSPNPVRTSSMNRLSEARAEPRVAGGLCRTGFVEFAPGRELLCRGEPERPRGDGPEQPVAAEGQAKELRVLAATARVDVAAGVDEGEGLDVLDDRLERQPAPVNVGREGAADAETVGAGLLLRDGPGPGGAGLHTPEVIDQLGPLHAGLDLDLTAVPIEAEHAIQRRGVHVDRIGAELRSARR